MATGSPCPHCSTICSLFRGRFCFALGSHAAAPFGPGISSLGRWKWVRGQACLRAQLWCSALSAKPESFTPGAALRAPAKGYGAQGPAGIIPVREVAGTGRGDTPDAPTAPAQSHTATMDPDSAQIPAQPHMEQSPVLPWGKVHPWVLVPVLGGCSQRSFYEPRAAAGYRPSLAHPAACTAGFTLLSLVPVSVSPMSPSLLQRRSFPSTFHPLAS